MGSSLPTSGNPEVAHDIYYAIRDVFTSGKTYLYSEIDNHAVWLEQNSNGYWRLRWMKKDDRGNPVLTTSGNYAKGSRYVRKDDREEVKQQLEKARVK